MTATFIVLTGLTLIALPYERRVQVPSGGALPAVVVADFLTHGALDRDGKNLEVRGAKQALVPWRVLQVGPGDFCRVAFQTTSGHRAYTIHYGEGTAEKAPEWTASAGLLMETRAFTSCDLRHVEGPRKAFASAERIGADYVANAFHRFDPNAPGQGPFFSIYRGNVRAARAGTYRFFTTSQDASFLLIDGKTVASAPGTHGPVHDARHRGEVVLEAGLHKFEYIHVATGGEACMVAAWQPPGADRPEVIPADAFGSPLVAHLPASGPWLDGKTPQRDFAFRVVGDAPLGESSALVRVQFQAYSNGQAMTGRVHWDFGDGQSSNRPNPTHIYMRTGKYDVRLSAAETDPGVVNRVVVPRAAVPHDQEHPGDALRDYLPIVDAYEVAKLDPRSALALAEVHLAVDQSAKAARAAQLWLAANHTLGPDDETIVAEIARLLGPLLRDKLDDSAGALTVWQNASRLVKRPELRAECDLEAGEIALQDLLRDDEAKKRLDTATTSLGPSTSRLGSVLQRLRGDYHARQGDQTAAMAAYARAVRLHESKANVTEAQARRGARSRSVEAFLREGDNERALVELRRWRDEDPAAAIEGYWPFLMARAQQARKHYDRAIALAGDHLALAPDSPYADQIAFLAAESEEKQGRAEPAAARYRTFLTDYPGSPLAPAARKKLEGAKTKRAQER